VAHRTDSGRFVHGRVFGPRQRPRERQRCVHPAAIDRSESRPSSKAGAKALPGARIDFHDLPDFLGEGGAHACSTPTPDHNPCGSGASNISLLGRRLPRAGHQAARRRAAPPWGLSPRQGPPGHDRPKRRSEPLMTSSRQFPTRTAPRAPRPPPMSLPLPLSRRRAVPSFRACGKKIRNIYTLRSTKQSPWKDHKPKSFLGLAPPSRWP